MHYTKHLRNVITRDRFNSVHQRPEIFFVRCGEVTLLQTSDKTLAEKCLLDLEAKGEVVRIERLWAGSLEVIS